MADHTDDPHGQSVAAWTAVAIMLVAAAIMAWAVIAALPWLFWVGAALVLVGAIAGKVLAMAGYGLAKPEHARK